MKSLLLTLSTLVLLSAPNAACAQAQTLIPFDDSYTVSQRYDAYKAEYQNLEWPRLSLESGQQILFDRRYKLIGARELHLDIFLPPPARSNGQGIVLVHGGAWRSGNKSNFYALANLLAQRGYAVFLPEYRLAPEAPYPAGLVDINDALIWIRSEAAHFGVRPQSIALGGESSGGHMAALLAYSARRDLYKTNPGADTNVSALIDLDGVLDFMSPLALRYENAAGASSPAALWLGGSMEDATARWREASPLGYVSAAAPPTLVISSGALRFTAGKDDVFAALDHYGVRHSYFAYDNAPHTFWLFEPYLSEVAGTIDAFLQQSGD